MKFFEFEQIIFQKGVRTIMLNRPSRFNAFNDELYRALPVALKEAGEDWPRTKVTVLTGNTSSPWYSSGNDLTDFLARFKNAPDMKQVRISDNLPFFPEQ